MPPKKAGDILDEFEPPLKRIKEVENDDIVGIGISGLMDSLHFIPDESDFNLSISNFAYSSEFFFAEDV